MRIVAITPSEREWIPIWGSKSVIQEKRYLTSGDDFPVSTLVRRFPASQNLLSDGGYKLHAHGALELSFVMKGHLKVQVEGVGEVDAPQGSLAVIPAGVKHAATQALDDTMVYVGFSPPYEKPEGLTESAARTNNLKFRLVRVEETKFVYPWGFRGTVKEKRLLVKEDGYGVGFTLRFIPGTKELAEIGLTELHAADGYRFHTHPCLEASYVVSGHFLGHIEAVGAEDADENVFIAVPPNNKHGASDPVTDSVLAVINVPAFGREPVVTVRDGVLDEG